MERKTFGLVLLLLIVVSASREEGKFQVEGRVCESQSHGFQGPCSRDHNCALVCRDEGFSGGNCRGLRRRCFCTKLCSSSSSSSSTSSAANDAATTTN